MKAQHTLGPFVQITGRPKRWGIPSAAQFRLLAGCIKAGGSMYQSGHSLRTLLACQDRGWVVIGDARYGDDDRLCSVTEQGRACVTMNSREAS